MNNHDGEAEREDMTEGAQGLDEGLSSAPAEEASSLRRASDAHRELASIRAAIAESMRTAEPRVAERARRTPATVRTSTVHPSSGATPTKIRGRGRPKDVEAWARRSSVLQRVLAGEITNAEAAEELGLAYQTWASWKAIAQAKPKELDTRSRRGDKGPSGVSTERSNDPGLASRIERLNSLATLVREHIAGSDSSLDSEPTGSDPLDVLLTANLPLVATFLTERELDALEPRVHAWRNGKAITFQEIADELGITRQGAHQLLDRSLKKLRYGAETQEMAPRVDGMEAEAESEYSAEPMLEASPTSREQPAVPYRSKDSDPLPRDLSSNSRHRSFVLKCVAEADRELANAIEECREQEHGALCEELIRARSIIRTHMRELVGSAETGEPVPRASAMRPLDRDGTSSAAHPVKRGRGRPENVAETARRTAVLARVQAGAITNTEAAAELGMKLTAWMGWKAYFKKRMGSDGRPSQTSVPVQSESTNDVAKLVARIRRLERFGEELREKLRDVVRYVEACIPE